MESELTWGKLLGTSPHWRWFRSQLINWSDFLWQESVILPVDPKDERDQEEYLVETAEEFFEMVDEYERNKESLWENTLL